jgi:endonuclease/exonuclease/phosphatase (EEP) superfamily protein YafD
VGDGYIVACHAGKSDKCVAVKRSFGRWRGCDADFCLDGLVGSTVAGCGQGARVARGVIDLASGGELTVVAIHGTSGFTRDDVDCRIAQFDQAFADLVGPTILLGDLNTDPGRVAMFEPSARAFVEHVESNAGFHFVSPVGADVPPTYQGAFNIDHIVSNLSGAGCFVPGLTPGQPAVTEMVYFDHKPIVCDLSSP